jgi:signal transduction histidine kinase
MRLKDELGRARHLSALGEMVATISHEIRNPLGIIRSSAELLKKRMAAEGNGIPDIIVEESSRLNHIITDFLNFARPREPEFKPCRIEEIIEKNIAFLEQHLKDSDYRIEMQAGRTLPSIMADADMLYQAFLNLLMNAMQAMPAGGTIGIGFEKTQNGLTLRIRDQGEGIPDEMLDKIWDPFFTTKDKGTGLGLGVVQKIIGAHQGHVRVANMAGGGAEITVELPLTQEE